jgi:hypothetical protein
MSDNETDTDQERKPVGPREPVEHFRFCRKRGSFGFKVKLRERKEDWWYCREHRPR